MEAVIKKFLGFCRGNFAFPYTLKWEPGLQIGFSLRRSTTHYKLWLLSCVVILGYFLSTTGFLLYFVKGYLSHKQYDKAVFHALWIIFTSNFVSHQVPHYSQGDEVIQLGNGLVSLIDNLQKTHFGKSSFSKSQRIRTQILYYLSITAMTSTPGIMIPVYYFFRKEHWQLGSNMYRLVLMLTSADWLASVCGLAVDTWTSAYIWGTYLISLHLNLGFMHTFKTTIDLLSDNQSVSRHPNEQLQIYSKLRIMTTVFNNVYGNFYVPSVKSLFGVMTASSIFISVRIAPKSDFIVGLFGVTCVVMGIVLLTMFIMFTAMVHEHSVKFQTFLQKQRTKFHGRLDKRLIASYKVEAVRSGDFYDIHRVTCLTVLALISNMSGSMLISVKM